MDSIMPAIAELERIYNAACVDGIFPNSTGMLAERPVITIESRGRKTVDSWYNYGEWKNEKGTLGEIVIAAEAMDNDSHRHYVMAHLILQMAVHSLALQGNKNVWDKVNEPSPDLVRRMAVPSGPALLWRDGGPMTSVALSQWLDDLDLDEQAFEIAKPEKGKKKKQPTRMKKWVCPCGVIVRTTRDLNATCNDCEGDFTKED